MKRTQPVNKSKKDSKTKMKVMNRREFERILRKNGWIRVNKKAKSSHIFYKHPDNAKLCMIGRNANRMIYERLVGEYDLNLNV